VRDRLFLAARRRLAAQPFAQASPPPSSTVATSYARAEPGGGRRCRRERRFFSPADGCRSRPTEQAKAFAANVWETLDKVRERVADMVLVHGGDAKGVDRLAASWAERRKVPQVAFGLDRRLGARAGFKRNEQMLSLNPRYLVAFAGNGVLERLVIQAKEKGVASSIGAGRSAPTQSIRRA
jgi:hypothetical protein